MWQQCSAEVCTAVGFHGFPAPAKHCIFWIKKDLNVYLVAPRNKLASVDQMTGELVLWGLLEGRASVSWKSLHQLLPVQHSLLYYCQEALWGPLHVPPRTVPCVAQCLVSLPPSSGQFSPPMEVLAGDLAWCMPVEWLLPSMAMGSRSFRNCLREPLNCIFSFCCSSIVTNAKDGSCVYRGYRQVNWLLSW